MHQVSRDIYWTPWSDPGCEHLHVDFGPDGMTALGLVLRRLEGRHLRCRYSLETDPEFALRELRFAVTSDGDAAPKRIFLEADGQGNWRIDGAPAPELAGCIDVDIEVTPFTNTLPIRRLGLGAGESADIRVAYLPLPSLEVSPAEQRYSCHAALDPQGGRFHYAGLSSNFSTDLAVDSDGLVIDYPDIFHRSWPR